LTLDEVLARLDGVQRRGGSYMAFCPSHDDVSKQSLSIAEGDDGNVLVKCFAGCSFEQIAKAIGMNGKRERWNEKDAVATYDYVDEKGSLLFQVLRMPDKEFPARHHNGDRWVWNLDGVRRVLYRLPELTQAIADDKWIVVVEGEKDAEAINALDSEFFATCNPGGAGKWRQEYAQFFSGAKVIIWADKDEPGLAHARRVRKSLQPVAKEIHVVQSAAGKDAHDHLVQYELPMSQVVQFELSEEDEVRLSEVDLGEVVWHWKPFVQVGTFHLLAGDGKVGKGVWLAGLAAAITQGKTDATAESQNVLIVASEDSAAVDLKPRIVAAGGDPSRIILLQRHLLLPRDIEYLEEKIGQERGGAGTGLVFIDPVANHIGNASSDDETSVRAAINELNYVAERTNCTIIGVRHLNKSGGVLGSGAWVNTPRIVLMFERIDPNSPSRVLTVFRSNRGSGGNKLYYRMTETTIDGFAGQVPVLVSDSFTTSQVPAPEDSIQEAIRNDAWYTHH
jgi:putative DNA primase/helicase